jgi:thioredoxin 1
MITNKDKAVVIEVSGVQFDAEVIRSDRPVIVMFWAPWSRPCKILDCVMDEVASRCAASAKVVKVNADDNPSLSLLYGIQSIPTLVYVVGGKLRAKLIGAAGAESILSKLESVLEGYSPMPESI